MLRGTGSVRSPSMELSWSMLEICWSLCQEENIRPPGTESPSRSWSSGGATCDNPCLSLSTRTTVLFVSLWRDLTLDIRPSLPDNTWRTGFKPRMGTDLSEDTRWVCLLFILCIYYTYTPTYTYIHYTVYLYLSLRFTTMEK